MKRLLLLIAALLFAVEITIPDAAADEYHDLGCYVGNMTRAEFYAAKDQQHEAFDAEVYRVEEAARIERNKLRWAALRPTEPCKFQVGDHVIDVSLCGPNRDISLYGDAVFVVKEVFYDGSGAWRLRSESAEHGTRDLHADDCEFAERSPFQQVGLFSRFRRGRYVAPPAKAAPQYRVECNGGSCRRVRVN